MKNIVGSLHIIILQKSKVKPFKRLEESDADTHVTAFQTLSSDDVDFVGITSFVCSIASYSMKHKMQCFHAHK